MSPRRTHVFDDNGCCVHCAFDGAEEWHSRVAGKRPGERQPKPDYAVYCEVRTQAERNKEGAPRAQEA